MWPTKWNRQEQECRPLPTSCVFFFFYSLKIFLQTLCETLPLEHVILFNEYPMLFLETCTFYFHTFVHTNSFTLRASFLPIKILPDPSQWMQLHATENLNNTVLTKKHFFSHIKMSGRKPFWASVGISVIKDPDSCHLSAQHAKYTASPNPSGSLRGSKNKGGQQKGALFPRVPFKDHHPVTSSFMSLANPICKWNWEM